MAGLVRLAQPCTCACAISIPTTFLLLALSPPVLSTYIHARPRGSRASHGAQPRTACPAHGGRPCRPRTPMNMLLKGGIRIHESRVRSKQTYQWSVANSRTAASCPFPVPFTFPCFPISVSHSRIRFPFAVRYFPVPLPHCACRACTQIVLCPSHCGIDSITAAMDRQVTLTPRAAYVHCFQLFWATDTRMTRRCGVPC